MASLKKVCFQTLTSFHAVLEEYVPGRLSVRNTQVPVGINVGASGSSPAAASVDAAGKTPLEGILVLGASDVESLRARLEQALADCETIAAKAPRALDTADLQAPQRIVIAFGDARELKSRGQRALQAFAADQTPVWKALQSQGVFRGTGPAAKVAFLYTGQGSQYANMLGVLRRDEPIVG